MISALLAYSLAVSVTASEASLEPPSQSAGATFSISFSGPNLRPRVQGAQMGTQQGLVPESGDTGLEPKDRQAIALTLRSVAGLASLTPPQKISLDANQDGLVTIQDADMVLRHALGIPETPRIPIKAALKFTDSRLLSRSLTDLLGLEVQVEEKGPLNVMLPVGSWTAQELLDKTSKQLHRKWVRNYIFQPDEQTLTAQKPAALTMGSNPPASKLASAGTLSLSVSLIPMTLVAQAIEGSAGCKIQLPPHTQQLCNLDLSGAPLEEALEQLGAQAKLRVSPSITFEPVAVKAAMQAKAQPDDGAETPLSPEEVEHLNQMALDSQKTQAEIILMDDLRKITGKDPFDPSFNIDKVTDAQWKQIGLSGEEQAKAKERISQLIEDRLKIEALSAAQFSDHPEDTKAIDPNFNSSSDGP
jgi:hypothetical protein